MTLARASMARIGADNGAAVRDADGRSYAAAPVALTCLRIGALDLAVAQAVSAGATGLEAAAVVSSAENPVVSVASVREVGGEGGVETLHRWCGPLNPPLRWGTLT